MTLYLKFVYKGTKFIKRHSKAFIGELTVLITN